MTSAPGKGSLPWIQLLPGKRCKQSAPWKMIASLDPAATG